LRAEDADWALTVHPEGQVGADRAQGARADY
jgi:hypothetical protein